MMKDYDLHVEYTIIFSGGREPEIFENMEEAFDYAKTTGIKYEVHKVIRIYQKINIEDYNGIYEKFIL